MQSRKYNGWTNYETWVVNLWLENDYYTYKYLRQTTPESSAEAIKEYIEESNPLIDNASLYGDLLNGAVGEINFEETAQYFFEY